MIPQQVLIILTRRVVASCHLEMFPPAQGTEPVRHHMALARNVKEYFHKAGIHSTTIQLEYTGSEIQRFHISLFISSI